MAEYGFIGTWELSTYEFLHAEYVETFDLTGIRFRLEENGDVIWTVPEELKHIPLFNCETYEMYTTTLRQVVLRLGAYDGHIIELTTYQIDPKDTLRLHCEMLGYISCKRVDEEKAEQKWCNAPFSLLPALEDGYFSDVVLTSANNKQFNVHSAILELQGIDVDWRGDPPPFSNLPEDALGTILHFLYTECLPENLTEATARLVITASTPYACLNKLVNLCKIYFKNMALKEQIIELVNDMHTCMNQVIDHFNPRNNHLPSDNLTSDPSKLCFVVKQAVRDTAVAFAKLLLLCDLFSKRKGELSRSERHEIIRYAKSRLPIFLTQLSRFLQALKNTFSSMSSMQRLEVATFLVPEIEVIMETLSVLIVHVEKALQQIIHGFLPDLGRSKPGIGEVLGKSLRNILHLRELTKLKNFHEHITCTLRLLIHNKAHFKELTPAQKVRSVHKNLEQLIEELPIFLIRLEELMAAFDEKLEWREFKFCFKVGTSKVSYVLEKLITHCASLQDVMLQLCELIQRDAFTQSLQSLGLLDSASPSVHSNETQKVPRSSSFSAHHGYKLNLVESLCVSPTASKSLLSKLCLQLFRNQSNTDMEFEIISACPEQEAEEGAVADEKCIIKAHRVIVAARCDWFRRALLSGMREAIDKKIVIHDTSSELFRIFLEYLYSGRLKQTPFTTEQLVELLLLSDRYEVDDLKQTAEHMLQTSIDSDSALYFLSMADQYNARILKKACLVFISQHYELTESEEFFEMPISLQAEIFDCVWTHSATHKSVTMEQLLPTSSASPTTPTAAGLPPPDKAANPPTESRQSNSRSQEDLRLPANASPLDYFIQQLRDIVGDTVPREQLVPVILAADFDLCRAVNYYYAMSNDDEA